MMKKYLYSRFVTAIAAVVCGAVRGNAGMRIILLTMSCFFVIACVSCLRQQAPATGQGAEKDSLSLASFPGKSPKADALQEHLRLKADSAGVYCRSRGFSERYCILVNFNIHSGKKRFFVWDFEKDTVLYASLCAHGTGRESTPKKPVYSNDPGSYCSSLGRYKTGVSSYSRYGIHIHYKLHGLDPTNNNAFKRIIVLHSHSPMPDREIYPLYLPLGYSLGCPVISDPVMRKVDTLLKESKKPVLLWIYDEPVIYIHTE